MTMFKATALLGMTSAIGLTFAIQTSAQEVNDAPYEENWAPTEWGPDDKVGAPNRTTPEIVMKAVGLVKQGKTATLGKLYDSDIPLFPGAPTG